MKTSLSIYTQIAAFCLIAVGCFVSYLSYSLFQTLCTNNQCLDPTQALSFGVMAFIYFILAIFLLRRSRIAYFLSYAWLIFMGWSFLASGEKNIYLTLLLLILAANFFTLYLGKNDFKKQV